MKWFAALYVALIVVQIFLAGEGIFGLNNIKHSDKCDKKGASHLAECIGNSKALDAHRALGFILTLPGAALFLIVALLAWHPAGRVRIVSIIAPILAFVQAILAGLGRWVGGLHAVNATLLLALFIWLAYTLRHEHPTTTSQTVPTG